MKKCGDNVNMISGEAQLSWMVTMQGKRRTLHKDDVVSAVIATDIFDFLLSSVSDSTNPLDLTMVKRETLESKLLGRLYLSLSIKSTKSILYFIFVCNKAI
ncbi:nuclear transcription factor Y subunit C-2-like [Fagus crenata]